MSLAKVGAVALELQRAEEAARQEAIEQFARATIEEIAVAIGEKRLRIYEARRRLVLAEFGVEDVALLGDKLSKNKYAAEKLINIFGGTFELLKDENGKPFCDIQIFTGDPDVGEYRIYTYYGRYTRPDGIIVEQAGSFSTKDVFFAKATGVWKPMSEINVVDIMVAAQTEAFKKSVFRGVGLGDWTEADKATLASETKDKGQGHDFKGAQAGAGKKDAKVGFGKSKGKLVTELDDKELAWYAGAYQENVENPEKKQYAKANTDILDAIKAEQARRTLPAETPITAQETVTPIATAGEDVESRPEPAASGSAATSKAGEEPAPAPPTTRGKLVVDVFNKLGKAAGGSQNQKAASGILRALCADLQIKETGAVSDLSDEQLKKILGIPDDILLKVKAHLGL
jgi:hypothetical protein